jgi:hypothetical protein
VGIQLDAEFQDPNVQIDDQWTPYDAKLIDGRPTDRLIVFRPQKLRSHLGCIRVYEAGTNTKLWDVFQAKGSYIGKIPKNCSFEAMLVEVKLITARLHDQKG